MQLQTRDKKDLKENDKAANTGREIRTDEKRQTESK